MCLSGLGPNDSAFNHPMACRAMGDESGRDWHLENDVLVAGNPLYGNQNASGADVHRGPKLEHSSPLGVGAVYENWKCDWEPLPPAGLALGFTHALDFQL
jgi:hypothetical protein